MRAFTSEEKTFAKALISQAKSLNEPSLKSLQIIESKQEIMQWETIPFLKSHCKKNPGDTLQRLETILRGMENALENCVEFPVELLNSEMRNNLTSWEDRILAQVKNLAMENTVLPQPDHDELDNIKIHRTLHTITVSLKNLPSVFFIFYLELLQTKPSSAAQANDLEKGAILSKLLKNSVITINKKRLMAALKCSLSLGLAVLFGSLYSKENGLWAGLPVAISLPSAREPTFKLANARAQGTVLGTVYGVLGYFVFEKYVQIRFLSLLPWFIFCSFLRKSKMYGQAGASSAVIGAVLILGRNNFGPPSEFAIARIVETFIGLSCSVTMDILFQPTRASVLARTQLSKTMESFQECVGSLRMTQSSSLDQEISKLKLSLMKLGKLIEEAEVEPNFWYVPFHSACYGKLKLSLSNMVDFLIIGAHAIKFLRKDWERIDGSIRKEVVEKLESDLKVLRDAACSRMKMTDDADLEMGKSCKSGFIDEEAMKNSEISFLEKLGGVVGELSDEGMGVGVILSVGSLLYCMDGLLRETREVEKGIEEILQLENPSVQVIK